MVRLIRGLLQFALMVLLSAGVALVVDVGSDSFSSEALASIGGLSVSGVAVAPRVVSAVAGDGFAQVTIADMSPDTGVYAVQWVSAGQGFNSYQMHRTTSKTMTVPYLACTRSYTLRVFVMAADWLLADGHQTQNVTPHSQTFDLTMPACVSTAPGVSALTCAQGGTCAVGDTGPGGGKVFYVRAGGGTFACGATLASTCKYLEAAPTSGTNAWTDITRTWATDVVNPRNQATAVLGADGTAIGSGYQNSLDIVAQAGNVAATSAAVEARAYRGPNNLTDWHLPSKDELNQMCKWQRGQAWVSDATICNNSGTLNSGRGASGFSTGPQPWYWSSSELGADPDTNAEAQNFNFGNQFVNNKAGTLFVRPVRAFG